MRRHFLFANRGKAAVHTLIMGGSLPAAIVDPDGYDGAGWLGTAGGVDAMGDRVDYNDEAFRAAAERTGGVRDRVNAVIDTLTTSINGRGKPWGDDTLGNSFLNGQNNDGYSAGKTNLIDSAENVAGTMNSFYEGQVQSADYLQDMEDGNRDGMR